MHSWRVNTVDGGKSLSLFLFDHLSGKISKKQIKRFLDEKRCFVNYTAVIVGSHLLKKGDFVQFDLPEPSEFQVSPISSSAGKNEPVNTPHCSITVLLDDPDFLVISKPVGVTCDPSLVQKLGRGKLSLVHRLDKETSGALILAKNREAEKQFLTLFKERKVEKLYVAIVDGNLRQDSGKIESYIGRVGFKNGMTLHGKVKEREGSLAITHYKVLKKGKGATLLLCQPITGRTHQIRVHLAAIRHPILGDLLYGGDFQAKYSTKRHLLHAYMLKFPHPKNGRKIEVKDALPADMSLAKRSLF